MTIDQFGKSHKMDTTELSQPTPIAPSEAAARKLADLKAKLAIDRSLNRTHPADPHATLSPRTSDNEKISSTRSNNHTEDPSEESPEEEDEDDLTRPDGMYSDGEDDGLMGRATSALLTVVGGVIDAAAVIKEKVTGKSLEEPELEDREVKQISADVAVQLNESPMAVSLQ